MKYGGKNPNGINQVSQSLLSIDVQGVEQLNISTSSVDINTSLNVEGAITASSYTGSFSGSFKGDGSQLHNIPPEALTSDAQSKIFAWVCKCIYIRIVSDLQLIHQHLLVVILIATGEISASVYIEEMVLGYITYQQKH